MSKKHYSKHCHICVESWTEDKEPLFSINIGDLEYGRVTNGIPVKIRAIKEDKAIAMMAEIDEYIDAYIATLGDNNE